MSLIDRNGDGVVEKDELIAYQIRLTEHNNNQQTNKVFDKNDENQDGFVSLQEMWAEMEEGEKIHFFNQILSISARRK